MSIRPLVLAIGLAVAGPVMADDVPSLKAKIEQILAEDKDINQAEKDEVMALVAEGEQLFKDGKNDEAMAKMNEALALLESD